MAGQDQHPCTLVISGTCQANRTWTTDDKPPKTMRSVTLVWFGGNHTFHGDASDSTFAKLGVGEVVKVAVPFLLDTKKGWKPVPDVSPTILKAGA